MSIQDGLTEKKAFKAEDQNPPSGSKTQRSTKNGCIGEKKSGTTKK